MKYWVFCLLLITGTAHALPITETPEEEPVLRLLPQYVACTENNVRYACYTLEQQKQLLELEESARSWQKQLHLTELALTERTEERNLVYEQLKLADLNGGISTQHIEELTKQLNDEIKQKNDWRSKAETPVIWPYVLGGIVGVLGLGFGLGAAISL